jgi:hypothetical protein
MLVKGVLSLFLIVLISNIQLSSFIKGLFICSSFFEICQHSCIFKFNFSLVCSSLYIIRYSRSHSSFTPTKSEELVKGVLLLCFNVSILDTRLSLRVEDFKMCINTTLKFLLVLCWIIIWFSSVKYSVMSF